MRIEFRRVTRDDIPLLRRWIAAAHVAPWWGEVEAELKLIEEHLGSDALPMFVFSVEGQAVGFIQSYRPADWPGHGFDDEAPGTLGIDLFIGEEDHLGRGIGVAVIEAFAARLFAQGAPVIVIDPNLANHRAVRAYEKVGFRAFAQFEDQKRGTTLLMRKQKVA